VKSNVYGNLERGMSPLDCNRINALRGKNENPWSDNSGGSVSTSSGNSWEKVDEFIFRHLKEFSRRQIWFFRGNSISTSA